MKNWLFAAVMLATASALAAGDPLDAEGASDHPEVPRFPGYYIEELIRNDFNEVVFPSKGYDDEGAPKGDKRGGKYWELTYTLKEDARAPSPVELLRNYENAIKKLGGKQLRKNRNGQEAVYMLARGGGERWLRVYYYNEGSGYQVFIVDVAAMKQKLELSANEMEEALNANGFVALNGILFDTGKANIKPESEALLGEIVSLLSRNDALKLSIEGHTDNVGNKASNLTLSKKRAESVVKYLVAKGIDARRLKSAGKGDTAPVADNRSEEGRAKNRRVELVKF